MKVINVILLSIMLLFIAGCSGSYNFEENQFSDKTEVSGEVETNEKIVSGEVTLDKENKEINANIKVEGKVQIGELQEDGTITIERLEGNMVYLKNTFSKNFSKVSVKVSDAELNGLTCGNEIFGLASSSVSSIEIKNCNIYEGKNYDVVVIAENGVYSTEVLARGNSDNLEIVYSGGDRGLDLNFISQMPPLRIKDEGTEQFSIGLIIKNMGDYNIAKNSAYVSLSGFNPKIFGISESDLSKSISELKGTKYNENGVIFGEEEKIIYNNLKYTDSVISGTMPFSLYANICYPYQTKAKTNLCINANENNCFNSIKEIQNTGAPIKITNFKEYPYGESSIQFQFDIVHKPTSNNANVYEVGSIDSQCKINGNYVSSIEALHKKDRVTYKVSTNLQGLNCEGTWSGINTVTLTNNIYTVTCTQDTTGQSQYNLPLSIELNYDYVDRKEVKIEVESIKTNSNLVVTSSDIFCEDSDDGKDYAKLGTIKTDMKDWRKIVYDSCSIEIDNGAYEYNLSCSGDNCYITEYSCDNFNKPQRDIVKCSTGCNIGACSTDVNLIFTIERLEKSEKGIIYVKNYQNNEDLIYGFTIKKNGEVYCGSEIKNYLGDDSTTKIEGSVICDKELTIGEEYEVMLITEIGIYSSKNIAR